MEKKRPHHDLVAVKAAMRDPSTLAITTSALRDAIRLGFDRQDVVSIITDLDRTMFHKSMTTIADHRVWQDVYHVRYAGLALYVKVQASPTVGFLIVSFKEK